jgi:excisionase family DNA binding protein
MKYLTTKDAAGHLGLSKRYLELLRGKGGGPKFISFGRAVRYAYEDLDAWADGLKRTSTSDRLRVADPSP